MPFHCFVPPKGYGSMHIFVPIDDEHTAFYGVNFSPDQSLNADEIREKRGAVIGMDLDENFNKVRTLDNYYLQDRAAMKDGSSFTGIRGVPAQDMAMQESMGPIYDRTKEHLGTSDIAIIRLRRLLLDQVQAFGQGLEPLGVDTSIRHELLRSAETLAPIERPWQQVADEAMSGAWLTV
jgi:phthalate 4,5-dioxygenase oxygenase subunit